MRKKVLSVFSILSLVLCSLMLFAGGTTISSVQAVDSDVQESHYLIDGSIRYESDLVVGNTSGYGNFLLGAENITLTTNAVVGFELVGWQMTYTNEPTNITYIDNTGLNDDNSKTIVHNVGSTSVDITTAFVDTDADGYFDNGTFTISRVFEDLQIVPVYDFIYYQVEVNDIMSVVALQSEMVADITIYYVDKQTDGNVNTYSQAVIQTGDSYYYYETLKVDTTDGATIYTEHARADDSAIIQQIDYTRGAYRVGDTVQAEFNVSIDSEDILNSENIVLNGVNISLNNDGTIPLTLDAIENGYTVAQDAYNRTERFTFTFEIVDASDETLSVDLDYSRLYVADINYFIADIDGGADTPAETEDLELMRSATTITFAYHQISQDRYLVLNPDDNNGYAFRVLCLNNISSAQDGYTYSYFNFASIDGETSNTKQYTNPTDDFVVNIRYLPEVYTVDFEFRLYNSTTGAISEPDGEFNVIGTKELTRGETLDLTNADISENIGYSFYGFMLENGSLSANDSYSLTIDRYKPQNYTILMVYQYINYSFNIVNFDQISLINGDQTIYPIARATLSVNQGYTLNSNTIYDESMRLDDDKNLTFGITAKIGDVVTLSSAINSGFYLLGYKINDEGEYILDENSTNTITLTLNADTISQYAGADSVINIYVYEEFERYTLTYYIEASQDETLGSFFMADISAQAQNASDAVVDTDTSDPTRYEVVVSNLKLYDTVVLSAEGKPVADTADSYYRFIRFTENDTINLAYTVEERVYQHTLSVTRNISIKVVYSLPETRLFVSTNLDGAYDLSKVVVRQDTNDDSILDTIVIDEYGGYAVSTGREVYISLSATGENAIEFGYRLVGYSFTIGDSTNTIVTDSQEYMYTVRTEDIHYVVINFEEIEFRFTVEQSGAGLDGQLVDFAGQDYKTVTVNDRTIEFDMPTGYYVAEVSFVNNGEYPYQNMAKTNDYQDSIYTYTFAKTNDTDELINIINTYGIDMTDYVSVRIKVVYYIHTYNIDIDMGIINAKDNDYDSYVRFPNMTLDYTIDSQTTRLVGYVLNGKISFTGIPYGAKADINTVGQLQVGISSYGWTLGDNQRPDYEHTLTQLIVESVTENITLQYKLSYDSFVIRVDADANQGSPTVLVNNSVDNQISLYDNLKIEMNALKENGFRFDNMYYYANEYQVYQYTNADAWNEDKDSLYVYSDIYGYQLNTDEEYDPDTTYYEYVSVRVDFNAGLTFEDSIFDVGEYTLQDNMIVFYVEYDYFEVSIVNNSANHSTTTLQIGDLNISPSEYATYIIWVEPQGQAGYILEAGDTVNYLDTITIYIRLNNGLISADESYALSRGMRLVEIYMLDNMYLFSETASGEYEFSFKISDLIESIPDDGILNIYYRYYIDEFSITLTTNIDAYDFYVNNNTLRFSMGFNNFDSGFGSLVGYTSVEQPSYVTDTLQFLGKTTFNYEFRSAGGVNFASFFYVDSIKVYDASNRLIPESEYDAYGIVVIRDLSGNVQSVQTRFLEDLTIELQILPILYFNGAIVENGDYIFIKTYDCTFTFDPQTNKYITNGIAQSLSVGSDDSNNIQADNFILNFMRNGDNYNIKYYNESDIEVQPVNVGRYRVEIFFNDTGDYDWLSEIELAYSIYLDIEAKEITLSYSEFDEVSKVYDGTPDYSVGNVLQYLQFSAVDANNIVQDIPYNMSDFVLNAGYYATITETVSGRETPAINASDTAIYNITLSNISLAVTAYNNNFILTMDNITIYSFIRIERRAITISGIVIDDKVYDETTTATLSEESNITLQGALVGDDVNIVTSNLVFSFADASVGADKAVTVDESQALIGADAGNYRLVFQSATASIYPYSLSVEIAGVGTVTVLNERGRVDPEYVGLIPFDATLEVDIIEAETNDYVSIYDQIARYLSNDRIFSIGYVLRLDVNGLKQNLDNNLYLSLPGVERLTSSIWLTGEQSGTLNYDVADGRVVIDLSQINANVNTVILTEQRMLLQLWQIILIVIAVLLLIAIIVIILLVIRKKRREQYSYRDTI